MPENLKEAEEISSFVKQLLEINFLPIDYKKVKSEDIIIDLDEKLQN